MMQFNAKILPVSLKFQELCKKLLMQHLGLYTFQKDNIGYSSTSYTGTFRYQLDLQLQW